MASPSRRPAVTSSKALRRGVPATWSTTIRIMGTTSQDLGLVAEATGELAGGHVDVALEAHAPAVARRQAHGDGLDARRAGVERLHVERFAFRLHDVRERRVARFVEP